MHTITTYACVYYIFALIYRLLFKFSCNFTLLFFFFIIIIFFSTSSYTHFIVFNLLNCIPECVVASAFFRRFFSFIYLLFKFSFIFSVRFEIVYQEQIEDLFGSNVFWRRECECEQKTGVFFDSEAIESNRHRCLRYSFFFYSSYSLLQ